MMREDEEMSEVLAGELPKDVPADQDDDELLFADDELLFADDDADADGAEAGDAGPAAGEEGRRVVRHKAVPWKVMIVDDDREVHAITKVVLSDFTYDDRPLQFISAYNATEACGAILDHPDTAVVLLDVVMETDDAGLRCVEFIRRTAGNNQVRIILRTGQPGQAPERQVIVNYDINDYKSKAELTAQKLFTSVVAALRSYQHIISIDMSRRGLEKIIDGSASLFEPLDEPIRRRRADPAPLVDPGCYRVADVYPPGW